MKLGLQINNFNWPGGPARFGATLSESRRPPKAAALIASAWRTTSGSTR